MLLNKQKTLVLIVLTLSAKILSFPYNRTNDNYFKSSDFGYGNLSINQISIQTINLIAFNPGYFYYKDFYLSIFNSEIGGNLFSQDGPYLNSIYTALLLTGFTKKLTPNSVFFADLHRGLYYLKPLQETIDREIEFRRYTGYASGLSSGIKFKYLKSELSVNLNLLYDHDAYQQYSSCICFLYKLKNQLKTGVKSQGFYKLQKTTDLDYFIYGYRLSALLDYNIYSKVWLRFGCDIVENSYYGNRLEKKYKGQNDILDYLFFSTYLSL